MSNETALLNASTTNYSLRFGLAFDRDVFIHVFEYYRIISPFVYTLTVHPLMLLLLNETKSMNLDLRLGILISEITIIGYDWIWNFGFRMYPITPYSGFYCGGPLCNMIENRSILMFMLALIICANIPPYLFILMRLHQKTSIGMRSSIKMTNTRCAIITTMNTITMFVNMYGFAQFGVEYDDAESIREDPELQWLVDRGGKLFILGPFGETQYFRYEMFILFGSLLSNGAVPVMISIDAIINLGDIKKRVVSNKTLEMTHQMLKLFNLQLNQGTFIVLLPLSLYFLPMLVDIHHISPLTVALRIIVTVLLTVNPVQASIGYIWHYNRRSWVLLLARLRGWNIRIFTRGTSSVDVTIQRPSDRSFTV